MLMGEHAVVYGHPCLVTAVGRRLTLSIEKADNSKLTINSPDTPDTRFVEKALEVGCESWKIKHHGLHLVTQSSFSGKYGFGSSAAVVVATLQALAVLFGRQPTKRQIFDLAYQVILAVQGIGSGFDVAAVIFGGTLYFVTGGKVIENLNSQELLPLVVGYTGIKSSSVNFIKQVAQKKQKYSQRVERIFQAIRKLVDQAKTALVTSDWGKLGKLMDFNQEYLRDLGVSSPKLEELILAAKKAGAWGAKLSGAGGGDCMIALARGDKREAISKAIRGAGGEVVNIRPDAPGVRLEKI